MVSCFLQGQVPNPSQPGKTAWLLTTFCLLHFGHSLLDMKSEAIFHHTDYSPWSHSWNFIFLFLPQRLEIRNTGNQIPWKYAFLAKALKVKNVIFSLSTSAHGLPNYMTAIGKESTLCLDSKAFHLSPWICPGQSLWSLHELWACYDSVFSNAGEGVPGYLSTNPFPHVQPHLMGLLSRTS